MQEFNIKFHPDASSSSPIFDLGVLFYAEGQTPPWIVSVNEETLQDALKVSDSMFFNLVMNNKNAFEGYILQTLGNRKLEDIDLTKSFPANLHMEVR